MNETSFDPGKKTVFLSTGALELFVGDTLISSMRPLTEAEVEEIRSLYAEWYRSRPAEALSFKGAHSAAEAVHVSDAVEAALQPRRWLRRLLHWLRGH